LRECGEDVRRIGSSFAEAMADQPPLKFRRAGRTAERNAEFYKKMEQINLRKREIG